MAERDTVNTGKESSVSGHDVRPRGAAAVQAQAVGKRTLTESVVQHRSAAPGADGASAAPAGASDTAAVHDVAAHGISGDSTSLPYAGQIQRLFGRHDISSIEAHTDAPAAAGARAMGAEAYATGNHVAFASQPDLHTAAHEAAHVVQQRAGVQLKGGVGQAGDKYEQSADAVADLVVQGKSAEATLDQLAPRSAAAAGPPATQHKAVQLAAVT